MVLINPEPPAPPPGIEDNVLRRVGRFLRKHEMWLIRLQAVKDSYPDPENYETVEHLQGTREFLEASKLLLELIGFTATIQAERVTDLLGLVNPPENLVELESDEEETTKE